MDGTNQLAITLNSMEDPRTPMHVAVRNGSRLRGNTRDDLIGVTIVLDLTQIGAVDFAALSDYVAMIALAPVAPTTDTAGLSTVMNLFSEPGVVGLTGFDRDYLSALYAASRTPATRNQQTAEIADRMATARLTKASCARLGSDTEAVCRESCGNLVTLEASRPDRGPNPDGRRCPD